MIRCAVVAVLGNGGVTTFVSEINAVTALLLLPGLHTYSEGTCVALAVFTRARRVTRVTGNRTRNSLVFKELEIARCCYPVLPGVTANKILGLYAPSRMRGAASWEIARPSRRSSTRRASCGAGMLARWKGLRKFFKHVGVLGPGGCQMAGIPLTRRRALWPAVLGAENTAMTTDGCRPRKHGGIFAPAFVGSAADTTPERERSPPAQWPVFNSRRQRRPLAWPEKPNHWSKL